MIGAASLMAHDVVDTPTNPSTPGPTLHLEVMAAAMAHQFLRTTPSRVACALVIAAGLLA
jgi:hypothetical protein